MNKIFRAGLWASFVVVGCSAPPPPPPPTLEVAISPAEIVADGVNTATVTVSHTSDVRLSTTRGKFRESNAPSYTVAGGAGSATLVSCDSRVTDPCAGTVRISAYSAADEGTGAATISFKGLENCGNGADDDGNGQTDCADTACANLQCTLPAGSVGVGRCNAAGACQCAVDGGTSEPVEQTCDDGKDNDCDGQVDCADTGCDAKACTLSSGVRASCKQGSCQCPNVPESTDVTCKDGIDNDCDGTVDCADVDCRPVGNALGKVCDALGHTCAVPIGGVSTCTSCSGNGGTSEPNGETTCGDAKDNDCDGIIDCQDPDCANRTCTAGGSRCNAQFQCSCPGGTMETTCGDNFDNDCDTQVDCADSDCKAASAVCGPNGRTCTAASNSCTCSGNGGTAQATETTCNDGFDNDCDGLSDCLDADCVSATANCGSVASWGLRCTPTGSADAGIGACVCSGNSGTVQASETLCSDTRDNDCDGLVDCADSSCNGQACNALGRVCGSGSCSVCTGNGGTAEAAEATCSDGRDNDCDGLVDCADADCNGDQCNVTSPNYVCTTNICKDSTSNFSLVLTPNPVRIAANGTATSSVSALLRNLTTPVAGAVLDLTVSAGNGSVNPVQVVTNGSGIATTTFTSSNLGGFATVQAGYDSGTSIIFGTAQIDQPRLGSIVLFSQTQTVMGVRTSAFNESNTLVFQVNDENAQAYPPGLTVVLTHDQLGGSYIGAPTNCTNNLCTVQQVTDAQGRVSVVLHSGTAAGVVSVSAGATAGGISQSGTASNIAIVGAKASGLAVSVICTPRNLPTYSAHDCLKSLYAGGDDRASCTAFFADRFGNVLGRPTLTTFSSESGAASAPSFTAGGQSLGTVLMTGYSLPIDVDAGVGEPALTWNDGCGLKTHNPRDGLSTIIVSAAGEEGFVDGNGNGVYDTGENFLDIGEPFVDANDNNLRDNNEAFVDTNSNNVWDGPNGTWDADTTVWASTRVVYTGGAEVLVDGALQNALSRWYALPPATPQPWAPTPQPGFVVGIANQTDGGTTPNTTNLGVFFTDLNFNQPSPRAVYGLTVPQGAASVRFLVDPTTTINSLGMNFTQQFCSDQVGSTGCGSTCASAPCYVVTQIASFTAGRYGTVEIKGTSASSPIEVRASSTLNSVSTNISVFGYSQ